MELFQQDGLEFLDEERDAGGGGQRGERIEGQNGAVFAAQGSEVAGGPEVLLGQRGVE